MCTTTWGSVKQRPGDDSWVDTCHKQLFPGGQEITPDKAGLGLEGVNVMSTWFL